MHDPADYTPNVAGGNFSLEKGKLLLALGGVKPPFNLFSVLNFNANTNYATQGVSPREIVKLAQ
jgi:hypothetical protein